MTLLAKGALIGKYKVAQVLGQGGFGVVYLAWDEDAQRDVAVKVAHRDRLAQLHGEEVFLAEARLVSNLNHSHIVPLYEVGRTSDGGLYLVFQSIKGGSLAERLKTARPSFEQSAEWVAEVADAACHAHRKGVYHR